MPKSQRRGSKQSGIDAQVEAASILFQKAWRLIVYVVYFFKYHLLKHIGTLSFHFTIGMIYASNKQ